MLSCWDNPWGVLMADVVQEIIQKARAKKARESEMTYIEADKYLREIEEYRSRSWFCSHRFSKDYKWALKRRLKWGPDAVVLVDNMTREMVRAQ